jgi:hypothetical protein
MSHEDLMSHCHVGVRHSGQSVSFGIAASESVQMRFLVALAHA